MKHKIGYVILIAALFLLSGTVAVTIAAGNESGAIAAVAQAPSVAPQAPLAYTTIITVNTTEDSTGDSQTTTCYFTQSIYFAASDGKCNLRRALIEASHRPQADRPILISFNLPLTDTNYNATLGVWTVVMDGDYSGSGALVPNTILEPTGNVVIDGDTQPGGRSNGYPKIVIENDYPFDVYSENNTIRNLIFTGGSGVSLMDSQNVGGYNLVESIWTGLTPDGQEIDYTGDFVLLAGGGIAISSDGNVISGTIVTGGSGIDVQGDNNTIQYNFMGTRADKTIPADRLTCVASSTYNPAQWYGGWGIDFFTSSGNQVISNTIAGLHSVHSATETSPYAIGTAGENNLYAYNTIGIDGNGVEVGTCGQAIFVTGHAIEVAYNTIVNARTSFFVAESDDPTEGAIFINDGSPQSRQYYIHDNIARDSTTKVIEFGPAIPESLRLFEPPHIISIDGLTVVGETETGYNCPNCLVELYLDDLDEGQDALELLTTAVIDNIAGTARFTATLPYALPADHGIRVVAITQNDYVIGDYLAGTTTIMSPAYGPDATFTRDLGPGWNLFSIDVTPPSAVISDVLSSLAGDYDLVLSFDGGPSGGGHTYDPANPGASDLTTIDVAHGYWIHITAATTQTFSLAYEPARNDTPITLYPGWNLVSYLPDVTLPVSQALESIDGDYDLVQTFDGSGRTYMPGYPQYSDFTEMEPGLAYWIKIDELSGVVTLGYPGGLTPFAAMSTALQPQAQEGVMASRFFTPTTEWVDFYGVATLSGYSVPNASVVAYDPDGVVAGAFTVHTPPYYGFLHVYADDPRTAEDEGADPNDEIRFTLNGRLAEPSKATTWTARGDAKEVNLAAVLPYVATPEWADFWGTLTIDGAPAPVGTILAAYDADGVYIGDTILTTAGQYGFLHAYGDDGTTTGDDEGAEMGDAITFRAFLPLGATPSVVTPSGSTPTWQGRGSRTQVNLSGEAGVPGAPTAVTITGPAIGEPNVAYTFTIVVEPSDVTLPITYHVEYTDLETPIEASLASRAIYLKDRVWTTPGIKVITVTATNAIGSAAGTHTINIGGAAEPEVFIVPPLGGTWIFTDTNGLTIRIDIPKGTVSGPTIFTYTVTSAPGHPAPSGFSFAGRSFDLRASGPISKPIQIGLDYYERDLIDANIPDEGTLRLFYWNTSPSAWDDAVNTCSPPSSYTRMPALNALSVPVCHLSEFGLFGKSGQSTIYLPLILKNS